MNSEGCVCIREVGGGGSCSYIMQIHSRKVIRATEQVPVLWINLLIGSRSNQILMGGNIGGEWERFSPPHPGAGTCVTENMSARAWCQPLSLRDEVTLNSAHTHLSTHTFTFFQYHKGKQPSLVTMPRSSVLTHLITFSARVGLYHH